MLKRNQGHMKVETKVTTTRIVANAVQEVQWENAEAQEVQDQILIAAVAIITDHHETREREVHHQMLIAVTITAKKSVWKDIRTHKLIVF